MDVTFWRGKRVLVTGHTGFKGSWLVLWLHKLGAQVTGFALPPESSPNLYEAADAGREIDSVMGDIRDLGSVRAVFDRYRPEIVFHLAAQSLVPESYARPVDTFTTNVIGTVNVLEAVRSGDVRAVVNVTSDKCYENREWHWPYRENEPLGGRDPYSSSKACAELVTAAYRMSFLESAGVTVASARAGNVIGGGDWAKDRLVPDLIRAIGKGEPLRVRNPDAVRPWQHVLEPLSGYLQLAERLGQDRRLSGSWNFGPAADDARSVQWIVDRLTALWGQGAAWEIDKRSHPHEAFQLTVDSSKARAVLCWKPRWALDRALESIVEWHKAHLAGADMRAMTLAQIGAYEQAHAAS